MTSRLRSMSVGKRGHGVATQIGELYSLASGLTDVFDTEKRWLLLRYTNRRVEKRFKSRTSDPRRLKTPCVMVILYEGLGALWLLAHDNAAEMQTIPLRAASVLVAGCLYLWILFGSRLWLLHRHYSSCAVLFSCLAISLQVAKHAVYESSFVDEREENYVLQEHAVLGYATVLLICSSHMGIRFRYFYVVTLFLLPAVVVAHIGSLMWREGSLDLSIVNLDNGAIYACVAITLNSGLTCYACREREKHKRLQFEAWERFLEVQHRCTNILGDLLPPAICRRVLRGHRVIDEYPCVSVLFVSMDNFSGLVDDCKSARKLFDLIDRLVLVWDGITRRRGLFKVEFIEGDYVVTSNIVETHRLAMDTNEYRRLSVAQLLLLGLDLIRAAANHKVRVKAGIATGPAVAGIIGRSRQFYRLFGDTVNVAARMKGHGKVSHVHLTAETRQIVTDHELCSGLLFLPRTVEVKGKGTMKTFLVPAPKSSLDFDPNRDWDYDASGTSVRSDRVSTWASETEGAKAASPHLIQLSKHGTNACARNCSRTASAPEKVLRKQRSDSWWSSRGSMASGGAESTAFSDIHSSSQDSQLGYNADGPGRRDDDLGARLGFSTTGEARVKFDVMCHFEDRRLEEEYSAWRVQARNWIVRGALIRGAIPKLVNFAAICYLLLEEKTQLIWGAVCVGCWVHFMFWLYVAKFYSQDRLLSSREVQYVMITIQFVDLMASMGLILIAPRQQAFVITMLWLNGHLMLGTGFVSSLGTISFGLFVFALVAFGVIPGTGLGDEGDQDAYGVGSAFENWSLFSMLVVYSALLVKSLQMSQCRTRIQWHLESLAEKENERAKLLLSRMLPTFAIERMAEQNRNPVLDCDNAVILFSDICGFTPLSARLTPKELVGILDGIYTSFDGLVDELGLYKLDTIGDAYLVVGGLMEGVAEAEPGGVAEAEPGGVAEKEWGDATARSSEDDGVGDAQEQLEDAALRVVRLAERMLESLDAYRKRSGNDVNMRIGIHCGPALAGVVGASKPRLHVFGRTLSVANSLESDGLPGRIHVSRGVGALIGHACAMELRHPEQAGGTPAGANGSSTEASVEQLYQPTYLTTSSCYPREPAAAETLGGSSRSNVGLASESSDREASKRFGVRAIGAALSRPTRSRPGSKAGSRISERDAGVEMQKGETQGVLLLSAGSRSRPRPQSARVGGGACHHDGNGSRSRPRPQSARVDSRRGPKESASVLERPKSTTPSGIAEIAADDQLIKTDTFGV